MTDTLTKTQREVARLYVAGWQPEEIARKLGVARQTVYACAHHARKAGVPIGTARDRMTFPERRRVDPFACAQDARNGMTLTQIAEKQGVALSAVSRAMKKLRESGALVPPPQNGGWRGPPINRPRGPDGRWI